MTTNYAALVERAITGRRSITSSDGLCMVRVEPDWWLVQHDCATVGVYVSVIIDVHGTVYCTCTAGQARLGCPHVFGVGEHLDHVPAKVAVPTVRHKSKNVGTRNGRALLTEAQVLEIRRLYATGGTTHAALAELFGVSMGAIGGVCDNSRWTHLIPAASAT